ncbi:MAG: hypothetical protein AAGJ35_06625 [Myxococcota bacterium]
MKTQESVDWAELAQSIDMKKICSTRFGNQAIASLLGEALLVEAVNAYVHDEPETELARQVLWNLRPHCAMLRCLEIYQYDPDLPHKINAVELLRVVADKSVLPWVEKFLAHEDESIQLWGAGVVDQLLWSEYATFEDCEHILEIMKHHPNQGVRGRWEFIKQFLFDRNTRAIVNYIWIDDHEITVGATDSDRWRSDTAGGFSGADARTMVMAELKSERSTTYEKVHLYCAREDPYRSVALESMDALFRIAWTIREKGLDRKAASELFFGTVL